MWDRNCEYCNEMKECGNIFCTKGHCNRHIIFLNEHGADLVEKSMSTERVGDDDDDKEADQESGGQQDNDTESKQH